MHSDIGHRLNPYPAVDDGFEFHNSYHCKAIPAAAANNHFMECLGRVGPASIAGKFPRKISQISSKNDLKSAT